jgi:hypothetical protein
MKPELSDSVAYQESILQSIEEAMQAISTKWVKAFSVIPALGGIQK